MDYLVADKVVIPEAQRNYFDENIVYLPNSYMVNDSTKVISTKRYTRGEMGLPELGFVFCCFHNYYKISPQIFEIWMRILHLVDGSVLWLSQGDADAVRNLQSAAQTAGISTERIIFAQNMPSMAEHLARLRLADLFLDTLPYNAHTTASDALWVGLPVLTSLGEAFAGRVAASLLTALCVPELITKSLSEYETVAVELARQPQNLQAVRDKIAANQLTTALFDTRRFASNLEAAYRLMVSRYQAGEPSAVIVVQEP
jgi:predicted O-linked N-acetylglucosamine transferase (SPINDLY family)